ncbi:aa3-type cytochrome c oxidase subunit IV [Loktanella sp. S4079]|nr:aa3-type cytochrome c oxidase subunit IV [Loktanella sp. S4079]KJZ18039.1 cytochrome C oxidase subunit IV [Loktanella sp. S4079]
MSEHKHGEMDITAQEKAFNGFMSMVTKGTVVIIVALILLALVNG